MQHTGTNNLIVLDRDGVINQESADFIRCPEEWLPLPGSIQAIADLSRSGFDVVVATNQSGIGRGLFSLATLASIHGEMNRTVSAAGGHIAGIFFCPHHPTDHCECRKPLPGLMRRIESQWATSLQGRPMIGDSQRDLDAAGHVGGRAILVRTGNGAATEGQLAANASVEVFQDLAAAAAHLIREQQA